MIIGYFLQKHNLTNPKRLNDTEKHILYLIQYLGIIVQIITQRDKCRLLSLTLKAIL